MTLPPAPRLDVVDHFGAQRVPDPYRWLEDPHDARSRSWSAGQDALARAHLDALPGRAWLRERLTRLHDAGSVGAPVWRGERAFWLRRLRGRQHAALVCRDGLPGSPQDGLLHAGTPQDGGPTARSERVLVDPDELDPSGLTTLDAWSPGPGGRLLAHQLSTGGDEESRLLVLDTDTGGVVDGPLDRTRYSPVAWLPDGEAFFYVRRLPPGEVPPDEEQFHRRVWLHRVGTGPADDVLVFGERLDPRTYFDVSVSPDGRWLVVSAAVGTAPRDDVWLADLSSGAGPAAPVLTPVQVGVDARTSVRGGPDGRLYAWTDRDAPRGRLVVLDPTEPADTGRWSELVGEDPEAVLTGYAVLDDTVVVARSRHALGELSAVDRPTGRPLHTVALPGSGAVDGPYAPPDGGRYASVGYTDHTRPPTALLVDARAGAAQVWQAPAGAATATVGTTAAVHAHQEVYASRDGTQVRLTVLSPTGHPDRARPTVLYGYGGFGISLEPAYSPTVSAWVEAGGVWAVAHLRGGGEEGEAWHRAGMREHKQNVFDDLHAAAEHLLAAGWTAPGGLGICGGSNGGLLVGAALTQRPELYDAVVCGAPLLDMVRYERFGLGRTWNDEYGTADDPVELGWLLSYSPYHAVREGTRYPATLFTVFGSDTRVDPLHARKTAAALQHAQADPDAPVLLRDEADVGHGARSVARTVDLAVDTTAFFAARLGLALPPAASDPADPDASAPTIAAPDPAAPDPAAPDPAAPGPAAPSRPARKEHRP